MLSREYKSSPLHQTLRIIPTELCALIEEYSFDLREWVRENKNEPAKVAKKLLDSFSNPNLPVATALYFLTEKEEKKLLDSPDFPVALRLYYLPMEQFKLHSNTKNCPVINKLVSRLVKEEKVPLKAIEELFYFLTETSSDATLEKYPLLEHYLLIKYCCLWQGLDLYSFIRDLISEHPHHLCLINAFLSLIPFENRDLSNANFRNSRLGTLKNVVLRGADLRGSSFGIAGWLDVQNADLTHANKYILKLPLGSIYKEVDFLGAKIDEAHKKHVQKHIQLASSHECCEPLVNYFNEKYNNLRHGFFQKEHPSWDLCVHVLRITRATSSSEFLAYRRDIPKKLIDKNFERILNEVESLFLTRENQQFKNSVSP